MSNFADSDDPFGLLFQRRVVIVDVTIAGVEEAIMNVVKGLSCMDAFFLGAPIVKNDGRMKEGNRKVCLSMVVYLDDGRGAGSDG